MLTNETQAAYDELVARIFEKAYEDLVDALKKQAKERQSVDKAPELIELIKSEQSLRSAKSRVIYLETWIRKVLPNWLSVDPEAVIERAYEVAGVKKHGR